MLTMLLSFFVFALLILLSAIFYVLKIIGTPPQGRAKQMLKDGRPNQGRVIACIGDSLTHGNIGECWVAQLRQKFPDDHFLNEGINGDVVWQVHQRLDPILACQPDIVVVLIGSNDAMGSIDQAAGERYKKTNRLPQAPSFESYQEKLVALLERLKDIPQIALCTLPPVGEFSDSPMNQHIARFNDFLREKAKRKGIVLLDVSLGMWKSLQQRPYPVTHDYQSNIAVIGRQMVSACLQHYVFRSPWDNIAQKRGQWLLFDQIHLGERAAHIVHRLVADFLSQQSD